MNHRRNVNNPFANKNRKTVGYSDHRYGNSSKEHSRRRGVHRSPVLYCLIVVFLVYALGSSFSSMSGYEEYNNFQNPKPSPTTSKPTERPTGKPTEKPTGRPTEKPTEQKINENEVPELDLGGSGGDSTDLMEKILGQNPGRLSGDSGDYEDSPEFGAGLGGLNENSKTNGDGAENNTTVGEVTTTTNLTQVLNNTIESEGVNITDPGTSTNSTGDGSLVSNKTSTESSNLTETVSQGLNTTSSGADYNVPEFDLLSGNGDIGVPGSPKKNDSLVEIPATNENNDIKNLTLGNTTLLNVTSLTASSVANTNTTEGSDTIDTDAVNKTETNTSSVTIENENDSKVVVIEENKVSPNSTVVQNSTANTTVNTTANGTISIFDSKIVIPEGNSESKTVNGTKTDSNAVNEEKGKESTNATIVDNVEETPIEKLSNTTTLSENATEDKSVVEASSNTTSDATANATAVENVSVNDTTAETSGNATGEEITSVDKNFTETSPNVTIPENVGDNSTANLTSVTNAEKLSVNETDTKASPNVTVVDETSSVDKTGAATSPNATGTEKAVADKTTTEISATGKNETRTGNDADVISTLVTNKTDIGADVANSTNTTTTGSEERGNLRGTN